MKISLLIYCLRCVFLCVCVCVCVFVNDGKFLKDRDNAVCFLTDISVFIYYYYYYYIILLFPCCFQVILSTKEVNEKARMLAFKLIVNMGRNSQCYFGGTPEGKIHNHISSSFYNVCLFILCTESVIKFFSLVFGGLAGSPRMTSCTLLSLSKLVFEFHGTYIIVVTSS